MLKALSFLALCCLSQIFVTAQLLSDEELKSQVEFTSLSEAYKNPEDVVVLNLANQDHKRLPDDMDKFVNLQSLIAENARKCVMQSSFVLFVALNSLSIHRNAVLITPPLSI